MARKIIDVQPTITVSPYIRGLSTGGATRQEAEAVGLAVKELIERHVVPHLWDVRGVSRLTSRTCDIAMVLEEDARCEHCNATWTETSTAYNGGCCDKDEANNPGRLQAILALAEDVGGGDFYRCADGRRDRVPSDWPWALASAALKWLDDGRPPEGVPALLPLISRVNDSEWVTVWEDPGVYPSNAGGAPLPDRISTAVEPNEMADDLLRLIDDMGLLPAQNASAA